jgi:hypothetical protein
MAEVAISRHLFRDILRLIAELHPPDPAQREVFDCLAFEANRWERCVAMTENATCFGARRVPSAPPESRVCPGWLYLPHEDEYSS